VFLLRVRRVRVLRVRQARCSCAGVLHDAAPIVAEEERV